MVVSSTLMDNYFLFSHLQPQLMNTITYKCILIFCGLQVLLSVCGPPSTVVTLQEVERVSFTDRYEENDEL